MSRTRTPARGPSLSLIAIGAGLMLIGVAALLRLNRSATASTSGEPSAIPAPVAFPAPDLQLTRLDSQDSSLESYRGQVVLVNVWATWCPPCRAEMPTLEAFYQEHKEAGFVVIAVDAGDAVTEVQAFVDSMGLSFPVWLDPQMAALAAFRYVGLPSSYVIDRDGMVRLAWTGAISREMLDRHLTPLLEN